MRAACEQSFGPDDEHLIATHNRLDDCPAAFDGNATLLTDVDAMRLQRSILSVFFRAHLSDHVAFREVDLGVHAQGLRTFLSSRTLQAPAEVSVWLRHLVQPLGELMIQPIREPCDDALEWRFYFPKLTAMIRIGERRVDSPVTVCELAQDRPVLAVRAERFSPAETGLIARVFEPNAAR